MAEAGQVHLLRAAGVGIGARRPEALVGNIEVDAGTRGQGHRHLVGVVILAVIQIQHRLDLLQGEADAAAAQDQLQADLVAGRIDSLKAPPLGA